MKQAKSLLAWRRALGVTQRDAARILQTSQNTYKNWERGYTLPHPAALKRVLAKTGIRFEDLLRDRLIGRKPGIQTDSDIFGAPAGEPLEETRNVFPMSDNTCSDKYQKVIQPPAPNEPDFDPPRSTGETLAQDGVPGPPEP